MDEVRGGNKLMKKQSDGRRYNIVFVKAASLYGHDCVNFSYIGRHLFFLLLFLFCSFSIFHPSLHNSHSSSSLF